ncbi:GNAT family N-acetyltransferase [Cellulosimicrobium cellulans]|uniref:GNAT family N-acetyltransferase n=1 Tax=Cellulosimicrobium cellulans TaxID=1710 RepID=UPI001EDBC5AE|nr:GNAT family N-acetyltransferase [Cellulosimicrobium cellulans]UKJ63824.1 GNAT family N-acetyltransferase [Cellulosimicrobium cellulans]
MHLRTATPDDVPSLYALWGRAFDAPLMVPVYETDDSRLDRTHVAVDPLHGGVVGSVYWTPRELGGPDGRTLRAGGVANVATAPEARGRGLVRALLSRAVEQMERGGADVALLFTGTPDVYRSSGFETFDAPLRRGVPRTLGDAATHTVDDLAAESFHPHTPSDAPSAPGAPPSGSEDDAPLTVRTDRLPGVPWPAWSVALGWEQLAALHDRFDAADGGPRPLTTRRTAEHWERRIPLWYSGAELFTARAADGEVVGYLALEPGPGVLKIRELGVDPTAGRATEVVNALARTTLQRVRLHRSPVVEVRLPAHPLTERFTAAVLDAPTPGADTTGMLRPVRAGADVVARLREAAAAGAGFHWPGDYL